MVVKMINPTNEIAEIKVSYNSVSTPEVKITSVQKAAEILLSTWDNDTIELQEEFKVMFLNRANLVLGIYPLSKGTTSGTLVDVKLIFGAALKSNASGIIITHNHPSGNLKPSDADIDLTKKIKKCADFLDITLIDHIIVTKNGYFSFSNEKLLS
jgi:DNA repair protein RadC